ncbi:MAG TPA: DUF3795 domain-containing protein [Chitinivibrionales bacterium]|nr:DUF3795 domain-containing protein [Chitinivibrionales bacterium]
MATIGVCGDNCDVCPRYHATKSGKIEDLEKIKSLYVRLGMRKESSLAAELACNSCSPEKPCAYPDLLQCANSKRMKNCGFCCEYPCGKINAVFAKTDSWLDAIQGSCTEEEFQMLAKAFGKKKCYLDEIHKEKHS